MVDVPALQYNKEIEELKQWEKNIVRQNWKIVCQCGEILYFENLTITEINDQIQYWHPWHYKKIYHRQRQQREYRGKIPAMQDER